MAARRARCILLAASGATWAEIRMPFDCPDSFRTSWWRTSELKNRLCESTTTTIGARVRNTGLAASAPSKSSFLLFKSACRSEWIRGSSPSAPRPAGYAPLLSKTRRGRVLHRHADRDVCHVHRQLSVSKPYTGAFFLKILKPLRIRLDARGSLEECRLLLQFQRKAPSHAGKTAQRSPYNAFKPNEL
jgi:hypothetical protein